MDKNKFQIPLNNNKNVKEDNKNVNEDNKKIIKENSDNKDGYTKLTTNVYTFDTMEPMDSNIYMMYNSACEYKTTGDYNKALKLFKQCETAITKETRRETIYEIYVNIALMYTETGCSFDEISLYYKKAMSIFPDRAEPYFYLGLYCNKHKYADNAYELLIYALNISYDDAKLKYKNVQYTAYGKFLFDELAITCCLCKKYEEAKQYIDMIIDDPDFLRSRERLSKKLEFINRELEK